MPYDCSMHWDMGISHMPVRRYLRILVFPRAKRRVSCSKHPNSNELKVEVSPAIVFQLPGFYLAESSSASSVSICASACSCWIRYTSVMRCGQNCRSMSVHAIRSKSRPLDWSFSSRCCAVDLIFSGFLRFLLRRALISSSSQDLAFLPFLHANF
jgi:hypothetical protein